jgi:uncharacterized protein YndB with AHSA1/START domain
MTSLRPHRPRAEFVRTEAGLPAVRLQRTYPHPVGRVWEFVTDSAELAHWFPAPVELDPRPGAEVRFGAESGMPAHTGRVLVAEAPLRLAFTWGTDELRFDLAAEDGGTRLTLTDVLEEANTAARNAAGWEVCLDALDALARGGTYEGPHTGPTANWRSYYDDYIADDFPSGAPVPGIDTAD